MNLLLELLDLIIQNLAQEGDLDSVRACCLTGGQLVHICRRHLFSSIKLIEPPERAGITKKFGRLLEQNPSLCSHVRELEVWLPMQYHSEDDLTFLRHLNLVERFIIGFVEYTQSSVELREWSSLSGGFVDSFLSLIKRNPITELHLFNIHGFPSSTFHLFSNLQKVVLRNMTASGADGPTATFPLTSLGLRQGFIPFGQCFTLPSISFGLTGLKKLLVDVSSDAQSLDVLRRLLSVCDCLEDLDIQVEDEFPNTSYLTNVTRHISPDSLKSLRNLRITLQIVGARNFSPYGHFDDELSLISGSNVLEKLEFRIVSGYHARLDPTHSSWDRLDEILSVDGGFPHLKTVRVDVVVRCSRVEEEVEGIQRALEDIFEHNFRNLKRNLTFVYATEVTQD